jgi:hypothetical protein
VTSEAEDEDLTAAIVQGRAVPHPCSCSGADIRCRRLSPHSGRRPEDDQRLLSRNLYQALQYRPFTPRGPVARRPWQLRVTDVLTADRDGTSTMLPVIQVDVDK